MLLKKRKPHHEQYPPKQELKKQLGGSDVKEF